MSSNPFDNDYDDNYTRARTRNYPREAPLTEEEKIQQIMQEIEDSESRQLESTRRALASIDDSERVGIATAEELLHQKEQLNNIESKTTKINTDLKTSQKHLTNIKSIFGGIKNWWSGDKDKDYSKPGDPRAGTSKLQDTVERNQASRPHPGERLRTDDGRGFYEEAEEDLDSKFMRGAKGQNQYFKPVTKSRKEEMMNENLDLMSHGMERLKGLAMGLGDEIESQNEQLDRINSGVDRADIKLKDQNRQMRKILK